MLRPVQPNEIIEFLDKNFENLRRVEFAGKERIVIPDGWHGEGKRGEALVKVGNLLTEPIAGTELTAKSFSAWMEHEGFSIEDTFGNHVIVEGAAKILEGTYRGNDRQPLLRFTRSMTGRTPMVIEFYHGALVTEMLTLTSIGNRPETSAEHQKMYMDAVRGLFKPFISKGTREERNHLGLTGKHDIIRWVDDCAASFITVMGDQIVDDEMQAPKENLIGVIDVSVATLQAVTVAIFMAQHRQVPMIMRIGAPAFGLGEEHNLNYMVNTLPEAKRFGRLAVGDMGYFMSSRDSIAAEPSMHQVRDSNEELREIRFFLGGGLPVMRMLDAELTSREKPARWDIAVRRASRVDNGPNQWAVLLSGSNLIVRPSRRDKIFLPAGTEITNHEGDPLPVKSPGLWVSPGTPEGGLLPVTFREGKHLITLYTYTKA